MKCRLRPFQWILPLFIETLCSCGEVLIPDPSAQASYSLRVLQESNMSLARTRASGWWGRYFFLFTAHLLSSLRGIILFPFDGGSTKITFQLTQRLHADLAALFNVDIVHYHVSEAVTTSWCRRSASTPSAENLFYINKCISYIKVVRNLVNVSIPHLKNRRCNDRDLTWKKHSGGVI